MNREPANKSMGFFAIFMEAYKLTALNKKIFSEITLNILFPLTVLLLSDILISKFIHNKAYPGKETTRWIVYGITQFVFLILMLYFSLLSTTSVMYTIACCYTSKDITYEKVTGVLGKIWGRLFATFFWGFYMMVLYTYVAHKLFSWFSDDDDLSSFLGFCLPGFIYLMVIWNVATVVTVLEKDYGLKALAKGWRIIYGKIWVSCFAVGLLESAFTGIIFSFCYLVVYGNKMNLVSKVFVGIGCYLLTTIWFHFSLAVYTVIYFVCKSYHNEDISTLAAHTAVVPTVHIAVVPTVHIAVVSTVDLGSEKAEVQLERVPV